jgi:transposase
LQVTDALEIQLEPLDLDLRAYARKQTGCRALIEALYGVGELTSVTILAELGDPAASKLPRRRARRRCRRHGLRWSDGCEQGRAGSTSRMDSRERASRIRPLSGATPPQLL